MVEHAEAAYAVLHGGADISLASLHVKKNSSFALGADDAELVCLVIKGDGYLIPSPSASDLESDEEREDEEDAADDEDDEDDEATKGKVGKASRTRLREGRLIVITGPVVLRTKRHGLRLLVISHITHSLLPAVR